MNKKLSILLLFIGIAFNVTANEVSFKAQAPSQVIVGRPFQLTYSVNQRSRDLRAPEFVNFEVLAGPYTSTSSSTSFVNGRRTSTFTQTYTYTLMAKQAGTFTISPATIKVDGEPIQSNGVRIQVLPEDETPQQNTNNANNTANTNTQQQTSSSSANSDNLFVRTIVSKTRVHEQEALLVTYKLYFANVDVAQLTNNTKLPDFTGFLKQELEQENIQTELEHYNGRNYQTAVLYRTILYPQHTGDIRIEPARFEAVLRVQTQQQVRSIFDNFFASYTNVTRMLNAPGVTIHVQPLPKGKPAHFSGGVGKFTLTPTISQTELHANEAVTIKIDITGTGNMKLLKTPAIDWPEGFEPYDPKVTNNFTTTAAGVSGTKSIEYLAIPRNAGEYIVPPISFSYFDIESKQFRVLSTPEYTINVKRGANDTGEASHSANAVNSSAVTYTQQEDIKQIGTDIRYIDTQIATSYTKNAFNKIYNSSVITPLGITLAYLVPFCLAGVVLIVLRKRIKENANVDRVRYKRANKVAQKRLRNAEKALKEHNKDLFYAEIEKAAWTYLSDRLAISTAELNKDNIATLLRKKNINEQIIANVLSVLSTAEFARYSPTTEHGMDELYQNTTQLINLLEQQKI